MIQRLFFGMLVAVTVLLLLSCSARHPLDIPSEEWQQMNAEQRTRAYEQQAELDKLEEKRRAREAEAARKAEQRRQELLAERRRNARYGDIVQCVLEDARADFWGDWQRIEPLAFALVRGETRRLHLEEAGDGYSNREAWAAFDTNGQTLSVCEHRYGDDFDGCVRLVGTFRDFSAGLEKPVRHKDFLDGTLRCAFGPGADAPGRHPLRYPRH